MMKTLLLAVGLSSAAMADPASHYLVMLLSAGNQTVRGRLALPPAMMARFEYATLRCNAHADSVAFGLSLEKCDSYAHTLELRTYEHDEAPAGGGFGTSQESLMSTERRADWSLSLPAGHIAVSLGTAESLADWGSEFPDPSTDWPRNGAFSCSWY